MPIKVPIDATESNPSGQKYLDALHPAQFADALSAAGALTQRSTISGCKWRDRYRPRPMPPRVAPSRKGNGGCLIGDRDDHRKYQTDPAGRSLSECFATKRGNEVIPAAESENSGA